jgi:hypothetical protein
MRVEKRRAAVLLVLASFSLSHRAETAMLLPSASPKHQNPSLPHGYRIFLNALSFLSRDAWLGREGAHIREEFVGSYIIQRLSWSFVKPILHYKHISLLAAFIMQITLVILKTVLLLCLAGALAGFLYRRRAPRSVFFGAMFCSTWIYVIAFWVSEGAMEQINPDLLYGFIPYLAPIAPVAGFLAWFLAGAKSVRK